ncbi:ninjurin-A isoform X2 [Anabrus simplex]|uniref:ninjurin-A isoform X2 n=1 Tax=Anabrus simplex TaxID=316456 RepID=UPI0035A37053
MSNAMDTAYDPGEEEPVEEVVVVAEDKVEKIVKIKTPPTAANTYAAKKTVAQGMMDIALITSNANQLRYLLEFSQNSPTFYMNVILITISLMLQVAVGVSLIFKGRYDLGGEAKMAHANRLNNYVVVGVFMVTIINVFVAAFSVSGKPNVEDKVSMVQ